MKRLLILLTLLVRLTAFGQSTLLRTLPPRPQNSIGYYEYLDSLGRSKILGKTGPAVFKKVDLSAVVGADTALAKRDQQINLRGVTASRSVLESAILSTTPPSVVYVSDLYVPGSFVKDGADTSTPADGGKMVIVTQAGVRYKRNMAGQRHTPRIYGAIPNDGIDDAAALTQWANNLQYEHPFEAGHYTLASPVSVSNVGSISLYGVGKDATLLDVSGDCDGLSVINTTNPGHVTLADFGVNSVGTKTNRQALYASTGQYRDGLTIQNVDIRGTASYSNEWKYAFHLHDVIGAMLLNNNVIGYQYDGSTTAYYMTNTDTGPTSFVHNIISCKAWNINGGIYINSAGSGGYGNEGIHISDFHCVGSTRGIWAITTHSSPDFQIDKSHIDNSGDDAIHLDGYQQLNISGVVVYQSKSLSTGITPARAIYVKNAIQGFIKGIVVTNDDSFAGTEIDGGLTGGLTVEVKTTVSSNATHQVYLNGGGAKVVPDRIWSGATNAAWRSSTGEAMYDPNTRGTIVPSFDRNTNLPLSISSPQLEYDNTRYLWRAVSKSSATRLLNRFINVTLNNQTFTIDPTTENDIEVYSPNNYNCVLVIDQSKATTGQTFHVSRYNGPNAGLITIQSTAPTTNQFRNPNGQFLNGYVMPATQTHILFSYQAPHFFSKENNALIAGDKLVATVTNSFTMTSFSTTTYTQVVAPGTLANQTSYIVKAVYAQSGTDEGTETWVISIHQSNSASVGTPSDLTSNFANYSISPARHFKLRLVKPASGGGTFGMEAACTDASMVSSSATVTFTLAPLF